MSNDSGLRRMTKAQRQCKVMIISQAVLMPPGGMDNRIFPFKSDPYTR